MARIHKVMHPHCEYSSWAACAAAERLRLGDCKAMVGDKDPKPCTNGALDESGYCGVHIKGVLEAQLAATREARRVADLNARLDAYIERTKVHPSVWP